jgi:transcriptional regulator with XRE-family HTH domain
MHFGLKQLGVAARMNIGQAAYAYLERKRKLREPSREKIAAALDTTGNFTRTNPHGTKPRAAAKCAQRHRGMRSLPTVSSSAR